MVGGTIGNFVGGSVTRLLMVFAFFLLEHKIDALVYVSNFVSFADYSVANVGETLISPSGTACALRCMFKHYVSNSCSSTTFKRSSKECLLSNGSMEDMVYVGNDDYITMVIVIPSEPHQNYAMVNEYYTGFMKNFGSYTPELMIVTSKRTLVSLYINTIAVSDTFVVDGTLIRSLDYPIVHTADEQGALKGVYIAANNPVAVYQTSYHVASFDISLVLPMSSTSRRYITLPVPGSSQTNMFLIIGTQQGTSVSITDAANTNIIILNRLETYFRVGADVTSTIIEANADIVVLSGAPCPNIPTSLAWCDIAYETMPPTASFGTSFIVAYMHPRSDFTVGILAKVNQTNVTIKDVDGQIIETLEINRAETIFRQYMGAQTISISSSEGVMVSQFGHGGAGNLSPVPYGDPSMMSVAPLENVKTEFTIMIYPGNDLNIIEVVANNETDIRINGGPVLFEHAFSVSLSSGVKRVAYANYTTGGYHLTHVNLEPFIVYLYGGSGNREYATCGGWMI